MEQNVCLLLRGTICDLRDERQFSIAPSFHGAREERQAKMLDDRDHSAQDDREDHGAAVLC
jgi:hypothetical protein